MRITQLVVEKIVLFLLFCYWINPIISPPKIFPTFVIGNVTHWWRMNLVCFVPPIFSTAQVGAAAWRNDKRHPFRS